ncbi:CbiX/SirB N-terminal domain-containing protein [Paenibacillus daejeonensis]|uniref:CbiX/SirB N-terminal domain-containing protein n=1 Tax=Paenibacillus daejeonensis TaxID=135193 RepID=UPI0003753CB2
MQGPEDKAQPHSRLVRVGGASGAREDSRDKGSEGAGQFAAGAGSIGGLALAGGAAGKAVASDRHGEEPRDARKFGILVISHGSRDADWVTLVDEAVAAVKVPPGVEIVSSFLELIDGRLIQDGIDDLEGRGVTDMYVLPLFVSSGSTHIDDIGQGFGQPPVSDREGDLGVFTIRSARITVGPPIDDDPELAEVLLGNIRELSGHPEREALLLVAHGSKEPVFHGRWRQGMRGLADRVRELGGFRRAESAMLLPNQAGCVLGAMKRQEPETAVLVVPLFLSRGYFTQSVIPARLSGLDYRYNGRTILPHPFATRWMERQAAAWLDGFKRNVGSDQLEGERA